jgi:hypothetical protein
MSIPIFIGKMRLLAKIAAVSTFTIGLASLALAISASALAQTSTDTTGKKAPAVQTAESQAAMTPASALEKLKKGNARFVEKNMRSRDWLAKVSATAGGQYSLQRDPVKRAGHVKKVATN